MIKVNVDASKLHPLTLGDSSTVEPGIAVVAIGSPFGLPESMTAGIVSAINRTITAPNNYSIAGAIQTDAAINHGNSGGPLLTTDGTVIGIDAQIDSDSGGNDGVGFAIPINAAKSVADTLIAGGKVEHAYLGIKVGDSTSPVGAQVSSVISGSPADKGGLKAGDVITKLDDKTIASADDLTAVVNAHQPGDAVTLDGLAQRQLAHAARDAGHAAFLARGASLPRPRRSSEPTRPALAPSAAGAQARRRRPRLRV